MIVGTMPCCERPSIREIGPAPCWERIVCEDCGAVVWLRHSRLDPVMLTEAAFLAEYEIDGRTIRARTRDQPPDAAEREKG